VRTPSDFGTRAETPSHSELLDWLTSRFIEEAWSLKKLHRRIMTSETYRQTSQIFDFGLPILDSDAVNPRSKIQNPKLFDPENRLLWRMNARRLSFEELRDSLLAASGKLDSSVGGKAGDLFSPGFQRRTLYGTIDRQFPAEHAADLRLRQPRFAYPAP
jgi:hypothetical protein